MKKCILLILITCLCALSFSACQTSAECLIFGHKYGEWSIIEYATNENEGKRVHSCTVCDHDEYKSIDAMSYGGELGSAGELTETTLIVSIFADDEKTHWDFELERDIEMREILYSHLFAAVDWIEEQSSSYAEGAEFIFDYKACPDLCYTADFNGHSMVRADGEEYSTEEDYISEHIDSDELKQKYSAQNVIYIFYFNTDEKNTINSWALSHRQGCDTEVINVFARDNEGGVFYLSASGFAHEILHCFGAYDLYYASDVISQQYVDHCKNTGSDDIMYTVGYGSEINQSFSELDAYYVGLTDSSSEAETWNLGKSSHVGELSEAQRELMENYPEYFGLDASDGLDVYVWQMAKGSYSFGLLPHSDANHEEGSHGGTVQLVNLKGVHADGMRDILQSYDAGRDDVHIVLWQNPLSSYIAEWQIIREGEDHKAKQEAYAKEIEEMLFGDPE